jgi:hypothetical protein
LKSENILFLFQNFGDCVYNNGIVLTSSQMTNLEIMPTEEKSDAKFVNFLLLTIFGIETLARATITGNAKSNLSTNTLDDDKLLFIKGI